MIKRSLLLSTLVAIGLAGTATTPALAAPKTCPAHKGAVYSEGDNQDSSLRAWHSKGSLYTCIVGYPSGPSSAKARTRKLGAWGSSSRLLLAGWDASWTQRTKVGGVPVDRISTRNMWSGLTKQSNLPLVPASGAQPAREALLAGWTAYDQSVAWATKSGDVVMEVDDPSGVPTPHGTLGALAPEGKRLLVASYPAANSSQLDVLRSSLHLFSLGGDGDECDTVYDATLTFIDPIALTPLGVTWSADSHNPLC